MPQYVENQSNWIPSDYNLLKVQPFALEGLETNYAQVWQDIFTLICTIGKEEGTFLEIGGAVPKIGNNTYLLEEKFGWRGISIELEEEFCKQWEDCRPKTKMYQENALTFDYKKILKKHKFPKQIDYLSLDLEPPEITWECLQVLPWDEYRFTVITYEHDAYRGWKDRYSHREFLEERGYELVAADVSNGSLPQEEWYVDPQVVPKEIINALKCNGKDAPRVLLNV